MSSDDRRWPRSVMNETLAWLAPARSRIERVSSVRRDLKNCSAPLLWRVIAWEVPLGPDELFAAGRLATGFGTETASEGSPKILRKRSFHKEFHRRGVKAYEQYGFVCLIVRYLLPVLIVETVGGGGAGTT